MRAVRAPILAATIALATMATSKRSEAQLCAANELWGAGFPIRVYVNDNVFPALCGGGSTCATWLDVERIVRHALNEIYQTGASAVRLEYIGNTAISPFTTHSDAASIHVYANDQGTCSQNALGFFHADYQDSMAVKGEVELCVQNAWNGQIAWTPMLLQHVVIHEIGHVLGMQHVEDCQVEPVSASVMRMSVDATAAPAHPFAYDIDFWQYYYGYRNSIGRAEYSGDLLSWHSSAWLAPWLTTYSLGRFSATNSRSGEVVFVGYGDDAYRTVYLSRYGPTDWSDVSSVLAAVSNYHSGVASRSDTDVAVAWLGSYDGTTGVQRVYMSHSTSAGASWLAPVEVSDSFTRTDSSGVAATYDPRTDKYLFVWRGGNGTANRDEILYRIEGAADVRALADPVSGVRLRAADTPSVACGDDGLGTSNCILAYIDADDWQRAVRWFSFTLDTQQISSVSLIQTHPYISLGSPSVAYWDTGTYPWMILVNQGGTSTYSWRKGPSVVHAFQDESGYSYQPKVTLPASGSRITGSGVSRSYSFVLDQ